MAFLGLCTVLGVSASVSSTEVATVMILSLDGVLLMGSCNLCFEERGAGKSSSVSVSGGGEDEGGRDEAMEGVDVGWDGTAAL